MVPLMVIHGADDKADHPQPLVVVTLAVDDPPLGPNEVVPGTVLNEHASPDCETVTWVLATVKFAVRVELEVVGATV